MIEYSTPDEENPEWTKEDFARAIKFKDLPPQLQRTLSDIQEKSKARREQEAADKQREADSLRE